VVGPSVSVVVVSRGRPDALDLCLTGLSQLDHPRIEVIAVTCPRGAAAVDARDDSARIKCIPFDAANISAARNAGIVAAAGDIVAFIDDDAVAEPSWLRHLTAPFDDPGIAATGGFVRGRNGIGFQWRARSVDATGTAHPLSEPGTEPFEPDVPAGHAVKTEGTNMAVRRQVLAELGGFDPAFRFYLDETDLNMRLHRAGYGTVLVPMAQVHHGYAPSARRNRDRSPRDLTEIGASLAVFLRKHCDEAARGPAWNAFRRAQRARLLAWMQRGPLGAGDVARLLLGLRRGWKDGQGRALSAPAPLPEPSGPFLDFPARPGAAHLALSGRSWQRAILQKQARSAVAAGQIVTVFRFSPTALYHRMRFHPDGFWEQTGGQFGRSDRAQPLVQARTLAGRVAQEKALFAELRRF